MRKPILLTFILCFSTLQTIGSDVSGIKSHQNWQLVFRYDSEKLSLSSAQPISELRKKVRTPGIQGAPGILDCWIDWLDPNGNLIERTRTRIPVGERVSVDKAQCQVNLPEAGAFVLRLSGPANESTVGSIRLKFIKGYALGATVLRSSKAFSNAEGRTFGIKPPLEIPKEVEPFEGPFNVEKVHDTGDDGNRLVIVFMGDGYTLENHAAGDFIEDVSANLEAFEGRDPWGEYLEATNIYRVDVASLESFPPGDRPFPDTYFDPRFSGGLLRLNDRGKELAFAVADEYVGPGIWDKIILIVNSTTYGGSGGVITIASVNEAMEELVLHEFGHSFAGLADEYFPEEDGEGTREDSEPNVDRDFSGPELKWLVWVEPGTPLPTPDTDDYDDVVGAFEGARYWRTGLYRPWRNCLMRSLGRPYCPVCKEAHVLTFVDLVSLLDNEDPPAGSIQNIPADGMRISVDPFPIEPVTYEWSVGGSVWSSVTGPSLFLMREYLTDASEEIELRVTHATDLVRRATISQSFGWTVGIDLPIPPSPTPSATLTPPTPSPSPSLTSTETGTPTSTPTASSSLTPSPTRTPTANPTPTSTVDFDVVKNGYVESPDLLQLMKENRFAERNGWEGSLFHFALYWKAQVP